MSFIPRTYKLAICATIAAIAGLGQTPNLYLLPNSSSSVALVTNFRTDPLSPLSSFTVQPGVTMLLTHPNGQKLYAIARSGADTLLVLDAANPTNVLRRQNLAQAEAAAISPDGRRLLIVANGLHIFDTTNDTLLQTLDVGNSPNDVAVALDGSRAFVLSTVSQRLTAVDLSTNTIIGSPIAIPGQSTGVAVGYDGQVYVSTQNLVMVIDGRSMTVRKEIQLNARPGKLVFTQDGRFALAVNQTPVTGSSLLLFDLPGQRLQGSIPNFNVLLDRLIVVGSNRVFALSTLQQQLFEVSVSPLNINPPQFAGLGSVNNVTDMAISAEFPSTRFLFLATPGSILRMDLSSIPALSSGQTAIPAQPGPLVYGVAQTIGTATQIFGFNTLQTTQPGTSYLPLITRVTDSVGRPLFGVNVTFTSDNPNAQIQGAQVTTNTQGYAQTTVIAPANPGTFNVTAAAGPGPNQPSTTFTLTSSSGSTGGGGSATSALTIAAGNGQMVREQFLLQEPLTVQLKDTAGNPVAGQTVTFAIQGGSGTMATSTGDGSTLTDVTCSGNTCTAVTDAQGFARASFLATGVQPGFSYTQQTITATNGSATVNFVVTTILSTLQGGGQASPPIVERIKPTDNLIVGQAGTTVAEAVQIRVIVVSGPQAGQVIPNVALRVTTDNVEGTLGPTARCKGEGGITLTDSAGIATCDLELGGRLGVARLNINIGSFLSLGGAGVNVEVRPGPPGVLRILQGNNQTGNPGQRLPLAFLAEVSDGFGNILPGIPVNWEIVVPNSITLQNVVAVADASGRVSALGTLGTVAGRNAVRVRAGTIVATFNFTVNIQITQMNKISGDGQIATTGQAFPQALIVDVRDDRNNPVPGQAVAWQVTSGSGSVSSSTAATDSAGRSSVTVTAGGSAGPLTVLASFGNLTQSFNLTVRLPGPVFSAAGVVNTASNLPGLVPCGVSTIYGSGIASGLNGVMNANALNIGGLPLVLRGVEVFVDGVASPIFAVANQGGQESVVFQTPCETAAPGRSTVNVRVQGGNTSIGNIQVFRAAPGIFEVTPPDNSRRYAAALRPDGSWVTPTNPARRGEPIRIAVTGLGGVNPATATNRAGTGGQLITGSIIVGINDAGVRVISSEYAAGMIGVYWVTAEVPAETTPGLYRSLAIAMDSPGGDLIFSNSAVLGAIQ
jgi:uncharacterized protein (TIGR03437 family)